MLTAPLNEIFLKALPWWSPIAIIAGAVAFLWILAWIYDIN